MHIRDFHAIFLAAVGEYFKSSASYVTEMYGIKNLLVYSLHCVSNESTEIS